MLDALKYLLSPIYTLPAEMLAEIFERTIDEDTHIMDVFRVSQVCSDWRQIAHNIPRLWTGPISVVLDNEDDEWGWEQAHTEGFAEWLARSGALPIPITLTLESAEMYRGLLEEVLKTSSRWRSLRLVFPDPGSPLICQLAQCRLDRLEELDLRRTSFLEPSGGIVPSFITAPRLRKLSMSIYSSPPVLVPWATLTGLTLRHCESPDLALDTLALCVGLVRASVRTVGWFMPPRARHHDLSLDCLRALYFALCEDAEHFTPFFSNISAPVLQELSLNFGGMFTSEQWMEAHFTAFQLHAPNITRLELQYADLTSDELTAAIRHAPSLTHLKLFRCPGFDDSVMSALRYKDGMTPLVPRLHHLVLEGMEHDVTDDILAGMIASRWSTDATLASRSVQPAVARWTHVELWYDLSGHFLLKDIPSDILMTST
ncbi:hypothetical protein C8R45DRAFT_1021858, partial [Mycena sanguinolenta]